MAFDDHGAAGLRPTEHRPSAPVQGEPLLPVPDANGSGRNLCRCERHPHQPPDQHGQQHAGLLRRTIDRRPNAEIFSQTNLQIQQDVRLPGSEKRFQVTLRRSSPTCSIRTKRSTSSATTRGTTCRSPTTHSSPDSTSIRSSRRTRRCASIRATCCRIHSRRHGRSVSAPASGSNGFDRCSSQPRGRRARGAFFVGVCRSGCRGLSFLDGWQA